MIISVLNQKGGVGKTTIAINIARFLPGNVLLVDSDPQGSLRDWNAKPETPLINTIVLDTPSLGKDILPHTRHYEWTIIDGLPQQRHPNTIAAIKCADLVLVPMKVGEAEQWAVDEFWDLVMAHQEKTEGKLKCAVVLSMLIKNTRVSKQARASLMEHKIPLLKIGTTNRISYIESLQDGHTVFETRDTIAQLEIKEIATEIMEIMQ